MCLHILFDLNHVNAICTGKNGPVSYVRNIPFLGPSTDFLYLYLRAIRRRGKYFDKQAKKEAVSSKESVSTVDGNASTGDIKRTQSKKPGMHHTMCHMSHLAAAE